MGAEHAHDTVCNVIHMCPNELLQAVDTSTSARLIVCLSANPLHHYSLPAEDTAVSPPAIEGCFGSVYSSCHFLLR